MTNNKPFVYTFSSSLKGKHLLFGWGWTNFSLFATKLEESGIFRKCDSNSG
jgi:hypothetical protein